MRNKNLNFVFNIYTVGIEMNSCSGTAEVKIEKDYHNIDDLKNLVKRLSLNKKIRQITDGKLIN